MEKGVLKTVRKTRDPSGKYIPGSTGGKKNVPEAAKNISEDGVFFSPEKEQASISPVKLSTYTGTREKRGYYSRNASIISRSTTSKHTVKQEGGIKGVIIEGATVRPSPHLFDQHPDDLTGSNCLLFSEGLIIRQPILQLEGKDRKIYKVGIPTTWNTIESFVPVRALSNGNFAAAHVKTEQVNYFRNGEMIYLVIGNGEEEVNLPFVVEGIIDQHTFSCSVLLSSSSYVPPGYDRYDLPSVCEISETFLPKYVLRKPILDKNEIVDMVNRRSNPIKISWNDGYYTVSDGTGYTKKVEYILPEESSSVGDSFCAYLKPLQYGEDSNALAQELQFAMNPPFLGVDGSKTLRVVYGDQVKIVSFEAKEYEDYNCLLGSITKAINNTFGLDGFSAVSATIDDMITFRADKPFSLDFGGSPTLARMLGFEEMQYPKVKKLTSEFSVRYGSVAGSRSSNNRYVVSYYKNTDRMRIDALTIPDYYKLFGVSYKVEKPDKSLYTLYPFRILNSSLQESLQLVKQGDGCYLTQVRVSNLFNYPDLYISCKGVENETKMLGGNVHSPVATLRYDQSQGVYEMKKYGDNTFTARNASELSFEIVNTHGTAYNQRGRESTIFLTLCL
jgi:hypothetical protein